MSSEGAPSNGGTRHHFNSVKLHCVGSKILVFGETPQLKGDVYIYISNEGEHVVLPNVNDKTLCRLISLSLTQRRIGIDRQESKQCTPSILVATSLRHTVPPSLFN